MFPRKTPIQTLQAGRGIAAMAVVVHHAALAARDFGSPLIGQRWLELGYLGVDFFFVLSGFIIYHSTAGRPKNARSYATARAQRIYLPYLPVGLAIAFAYALVPGLSDGERHWSWLPTLTLLPISSPALSVAWTLQHEIFFYAIFGAAWFCGCLVPVLCFWGAAIVANSAWLHWDAIPLALINLEFLMGIAIAMLKDRASPPFAAAALIASAWLLLGASRDWSPLVGLAFALAIWRLVRLEAAARLSVPNWLVFLGGASYSIYLVHGLAISVVGRLATGSATLVLLTGLASGLAAGIAYFLLVERPLLNLASRFTPRSTHGLSAGRVAS